VRQQLRAAPHMSTGGSARGSPEIAERLMCAVLIIRKVRPQVRFSDFWPTPASCAIRLPCQKKRSKSCGREPCAGR
jgi:hypothetical protein